MPRQVPEWFGHSGWHRRSKSANRGPTPKLVWVAAEVEIASMRIPEKLKWLERNDDGKRWLADLPNRVAELAHDWDLIVGAPYEGANVSYVVPVLRGTKEMVLKVQWPHDECTHEANALRVWNGNGSIKLLEYDADRHALLVERCTPGTCLAAARDVDPISVLTDLLPRLWQPAGSPFISLKDEALRWATTMHASWATAGQRCELELVDAAAEFLLQLASSQGDQVLLHQDLHGENVLASQREPWLVIDPKPLVGEREFSLSPIIRSFELGHTKHAVLERLNRLSADLHLDRERVRRWTIGQTVAWSFDSSNCEMHETARWLLGA
jgi:streptomycin 6-kinase